MFSKTTSKPDLTTCLYRKIFQNFTSERSRQHPKHNSLLFFIYFNSKPFLRFYITVNCQKWQKITGKRQSYHPIHTLKYGSQGVLSTESVDEIEILKRDCSDKVSENTFLCYCLAPFVMSWLKVLWLVISLILLNRVLSTKVKKKERKKV